MIMAMSMENLYFQCQWDIEVTSFFGFLRDRHILYIAETPDQYTTCRYKCAYRCCAVPWQWSLFVVKNRNVSIYLKGKTTFPTICLHSIDKIIVNDL